MHQDADLLLVWTNQYIFFNFGIRFFSSIKLITLPDTWSVMYLDNSFWFWTTLRVRTAKKKYISSSCTYLTVSSMQFCWYILTKWITSPWQFNACKLSKTFLLVFLKWVDSEFFLLFAWLAMRPAGASGGHREDACPPRRDSLTTESGSSLLLATEILTSSAKLSAFVFGRRRLKLHSEKTEVARPKRE